MTRTYPDNQTKKITLLTFLGDETLQRLAGRGDKGGASSYEREGNYISKKHIRIDHITAKLILKL